MIIDSVVVGDLAENCYIISKDNKCLILDPGDEANRIIDKVGEKEVLAILITHHHFDHVGALDEIKNKYKVDIYDFNTTEEKEYNIDNFKFTVINNPGHTNDSISFYFKNENTMFVGDFIFRNSIGRCDLGGNELDMKKSIEKLKEFKEDIILYPGHGEKTNLEYEKVYNPFF